MISNQDIRDEIAKDPNRSAAEIKDVLCESISDPKYRDSVRRRVWDLQKKAKKSDHTALEDECETVGIPVENVGNYWYKGKHFSIHVKQDVQNFNEQIEEIVKEYVPKKNIQLKQRKDTTPKILKATVSDMHVGLEPNPNKEGLFQYIYNAEIFAENLQKVYESIIKEFHTHGAFEVLYLDDLGDGLDGMDSMTTRRNHTLEQNMDNKTAFKTYMHGKLNLIEQVISSGVSERVVIRSVSNCNHAGDFGYMANYAIKSIIDRTYGNTVDFHILDLFMEHFTYGEHTWILTHGKDKKYMKFGLPLNLNDKTINFINEYINHYNINSKYIHVEKGDLHQAGYQRTKKFDYRNFMSFAPPSNWVQHNFGDCYSGYSIQVIPSDSNEISHTDYYFDLQKLV